MSPKGGVRTRIAEAQAVRDVVEGQSSSSSHRSGGIRGRVADSGAGPDAKNPLIDTLKQKWGKGKVSANDVEEIIGGATAQGASQLPPLSSPAQPQNFQRSLKAAFGYPSGAPRFTWARIPTASGDRFHPPLCPHDWLRSLFRERPRWWESSVRGDDGAAERYWDELQESEVLRDHPELLTEDRRWFIQCGLHGDAGQFSHNDSLMVISFNSLIGSGVTKNQRYLITVCKKSDMCPGTLDSLFRVIACSFNVLQTGIEPVVDWEGKDLMCEDPMYLAAKYKAILTHIRGDWEFHASASSLPKWNNVARMCWLCRATGTEGHELSYGRCDRDAPWRSTRVTHAGGLSFSTTGKNFLRYSGTRGACASRASSTLSTQPSWGSPRTCLETFSSSASTPVSSEQPLTPTMLGRSARRRQIVSTERSRKTAFAPRTAGQNSTPKVALRDAWSRTLWERRKDARAEASKAEASAKARLVNNRATKPPLVQFVDEAFLLLLVVT